MKTIMDRFISKVIKRNDGCWEWVGAKKSRNPDRAYGLFKLNGKWIVAHKIAWKLFIGEIPEGMLLLHKCNRPWCVNPEHLYLGDQSLNMRDMIRSGRSPNPPKLTQDEVDQIRDMYKKSSVTKLSLAKRFGIGTRTVREILSNSAIQGRSSKEEYSEPAFI